MDKKDYQDKIESKIKRNFVMSYRNTEENRSVVDTFIMFCKKETDNHYLLGLKKLIESYSTDWKYSTLMIEIEELKKELKELKEKKELGINVHEKSDKKIKTFGGE